MAGPFDDDEVGRDVAGPKGITDLLAVPQGHQFVLVAVDHQRRGVVVGDLLERGVAVAVLAGELERRELLQVARRRVEVGGEIGRREDGSHGRHTRLVVAAPGSGVGCRAEHEREVTAGAETENAEAVAVDVVLGGMVGDMLEGRSHVGDDFGDEILRAAAVTHRTDRVAAIEKGLREREHRRGGHPLRHPAATDHEKEAGAGLVAGACRTEDVVRERHPILVPIDDIGRDRHSGDRRFIGAPWGSQQGGHEEERGGEEGLKNIELDHGRFLVERIRRMRALVELSWRSSGETGLSSSGRIRPASTLPSSTPH